MAEEDGRRAAATGEAVRRRAPLLAALALAASCGAPPEGTDGRSGEVTTPVRPVLERIALDAAAASAAGALEMTAGEDDVALLLELALADPAHDIGISRVIAPDGTVVHDSAFGPDSWEPVRFASEIVAEPIVGTGDLALSLPSTPHRPVSAGRWRVEFETEPPDAPLARAVLTLKRDVDGAVADGAAHVVDVHVHVLHPDARYRGARFGRALDTAWRAAFERMLAPHALAVGAIEVTVGSRRERRRLAELEGEEELAEACRAIRLAGDEAGSADARESGAAAETAPVFHVGFVAEIVDAGESIAIDEGDWTTGLAPQPGMVWDERSPGACAFVAERPWRERDTDGRVLDEATVVELLAANLLHELGHFAGLAHPSEVDGVTFDLLDDTPRCTSPDADVCGIAGGADNLMFHSGDAATLPWTLTPEQAWVLRRHPLFRPVATTR